MQEPAKTQLNLVEPHRQRLPFGGHFQFSIIALWVDFTSKAYSSVTQRTDIHNVYDNMSARSFELPLDMGMNGTVFIVFGIHLFGTSPIGIYPLEAPSFEALDIMGVDGI